MSPTTELEINKLIAEQQLPDEYVRQLKKYVAPLATSIADKADDISPLILGIQGSQGSGKSTLALFLSTLLKHEFKVRTEICSIDDFYLSRKVREGLATSVHPLLKTRGVPGTHDVEGIRNVFESFKQQTPFTIPRFNKATDDIAPKSEWTHVEAPTDILIFEGWCVGIQAQSAEELKHPCNQLEKHEDPNALWREYVNTQLVEQYADLFEYLDLLAVIQAPSFACVYQWRAEQETKLIRSLRARGLSTEKTMSEAELERFIQHYQRLTDHGLHYLAHTADYVLRLNENHEFEELISQQTQAASES